MPCMHDTEESMHRQQVQRMKADLDRLTQDLCYLCGTLVSRGWLVACGTPRIIQWFADHQKTDEERVIKQMREMFEAGFSPGSVSQSQIEEAEAVHPVSDYHCDWFVQLAEALYAEIKKEDAEAGAERAKENSETRARADLISSALSKLTVDEVTALGQLTRGSK